MTTQNDYSNEIESSQREQQMLLQEQIDQSNAEIEQKRQSVFDERLNIIKSQSAPNWNPISNTKSPMANTNPMSSPGKTKNLLFEKSVGLNTKNNPLQQRGV